MEGDETSVLKRSLSAQLVLVLERSACAAPDKPSTVDSWTHCPNI